MRILHIADLHLGKTLGAYDLIPDQRFMLEQVIRLCHEHIIDLVLIAGDLYDRSLPGIDAVALADWFFSTLLNTLKIQVVLISGNHDSPERVGYCSGILKDQGLHVATRFDPTCSPLTFHDAHGPVLVYAIPFVDPSVDSWARDNKLRTHNDFWFGVQEQCSQRWSANLHEAKARKILMAHCFASGMHETDSERPLAIGGTSLVDPRCFTGFNYVALGHLHRKQCPSPGVYYCGSPLAYSASEANQDKYALLVELDEDGQVSVQDLVITPKHPVHLIRGLFADLIDPSYDPGIPADSAYTYIRLLDAESIPDCFQVLAKRYPYLVHVARESQIALGNPEADRSKRKELLEKAELPLLREFFNFTSGIPPSISQENILAELITAMHSEPN